MPGRQGEGFPVKERVYAEAQGCAARGCDGHQLAGVRGGKDHWKYCPLWTPSLGQRGATDGF